MCDADRDYAVDIMKTMFPYTCEKKFTDFKIRAGGRTTYCHQAVISAKSSYFHALCSSGLREAMLDHPVLKEEDGEILDSVIQFLYLGRCKITTHNVEALLFAADFIQLRELKTKCEAFMSANLTTGNLLAYHKLAKKTGLTGLCGECERLSKNNFSEVSRSEWILSLSVEELKDYLLDEALNVQDEDDVLEAVERWLSNCQEEKASKFIETIFPCVRVQFCSPSRLETMSKDATVMPLLRLKISEYLLHGLHGGGAARQSYSAACRARGVARKTPSGTPGTSSAIKLATSDASTALKPAASSEDAIRRLHTAPKPSTSAALPATDDLEEILIVGGYETGTVPHKSIVFLDRDAGSSVSTPGTILAECINYSVCMDQNSLIFSGGYNRSTKRSSTKVQIYDINGNIWTDLPHLTHPVQLHGSAIVNGNFYSVGGSCGEDGVIKHRYSTVHKLHIRSSTWSECRGLQAPVSTVGIATVGEDIMVIGGWTENGLSNQTYRYSTTSNTMVPCQPMPRTDNVYHSTVAKDHRVFVLAGSLFLCYDVRADQWTELPMPMKPSHLTAMVLKQHKLIALGGNDGDWKKPNDRVQEYDIRNNKWSLEDKTMPLMLTYHWAFSMKLRR